MRKRLTTLLTTTLLISMAVQPVRADFEISREMVRQALDQLDEALDNRSRYIAHRQARIDSLIADSTSTMPVDRLMRIADEYTSFNNDGAMRCLFEGTRVATGVETLPFRWKYASLLPLAGLTEEAIALYDSIPADSVPTAELVSFYDSGRQMYSYIAAFFESFPDLAKQHTAKALEYQQRMLEILPKDSREYKFNLGEYYFLTGQTSKAKALLGEIIDSEAPDSNLRARAAHHLSTMASESGDDEATIYYLALSAIADVRAATREVVSLQELGAKIYRSNDVKRAHAYLSTALENAVECGAPLRMIQSSRALPIIEHAHSQNLRQSRHIILIVLAIMAVLMLSLVVILLVLRHEMAKMRVLESNLRNANKIKEVYISQFLQLCSIYMDKLNQFCKIANRKLAAGQADDLYRMTRSGKFVEEQSRDFYDVFDNAFLHIYPNFVADVNALLRPDQQITLRDGEMLNTDLRILAFIRLGIEESSRIAQVLNYSLNTIYAYRNRLKSRAIKRDSFEDDIMKISSVA